MSTTSNFGGPPLDDAHVPVAPPQSGHPPNHEGPAVDLELVQETRNQIRNLVLEIQQLSQAELPVGEFYGEYLPRVVLAMASFGGAIWRAGADGNLDLQYQVNLAQTGVTQSVEDQSRHQWLLRRVIADGQAAIVPPHSGPTDPNEPGNPTPFLLIFAPIKVEQQVEGVIEIFQRPAGGLPTQRGYLRFLTQVADHASNFLQLHRLRSMGEQHSLWEKIERFVDAVHRRLDSRSTAYVIANDGRNLIECDRVSVVVRRANRWSCLSSSGVEAIHARANEVRRMEELARVVAAANRPIWSHESDQLAPQIVAALEAHVDQSHARLVGVLPLIARADSDESTPSAPSIANGPGGTSERSDDPSDASSVEGPDEPLGVLIIEQFQSAAVDESLRERTRLVARHSAAALHNALEHEEILLLPLLRTLGASRWRRALRRWPKWMPLTVGTLLVIGCLAAIPVEFTLPALGKLRPAERQEIFASHDGIVTEVHARHQRTVAENELLVRLSNNELEGEIARLESEVRTNHQHIQRLEREQQDLRLSTAERSRISGELVDRRQQRGGLEQQLRLLNERHKQLDVRSPMAGTIVTWRVHELLMRRPVQRGQALMTVINPDGPWELELFLPERNGGHLARAVPADANSNESSESSIAPNTPGSVGTPVSFRLTSHPDRVLRGTVQEIRRAAEVNDEQGNVVCVRVAISADDLPERRADTSVVAKVHCGRRCLGYVVLRDLWETIQSRVLFWFG